MDVPSSSPSRRAVLLVDDAHDERSIFATVLRNEGYSVIEAEDGRAALDLLLASEGTEPFVVIVDAVMPKMTGWEFIAIMRSYIRLARIPTIIVSGRAWPDDAQANRAADHFLRKPFRSNELLELVAKLAPS